MVVEKRVDSARKLGSATSRLTDRLSNFVKTEDSLTGRREMDTSKLAVVATGGVLLLISGLTAAGLTIKNLAPKPSPPSSVAAKVPASGPDPRTAPPQPAPQPVQAPAPATPASTPRPAGQAPSTSRSQPPTASAPVSKSSEQLAVDARNAAFARVNLRRANRQAVRGEQYTLPPAPPQMPQISPPTNITQLSELPALQPAAFSRPQQPSFQQRPALPPASQPGYSQFQPTSLGTAISSEQYAAPQRALARSTWTRIPPSTWVRAVTTSRVDFLRSAPDGTLFAQVDGAIRVNGEVVIPDGAILTGRVVRFSEPLGRAYVEFTSIAIDAQTLPIRATAWTDDGSRVEGVRADATEIPNSLVADATAGLGAASAEAANSIGRNNTSSVSSIGLPYTSTTFDNSPEVIARRAAAGMAATVFNRQTRRNDQRFSRDDQRGPVYVLREKLVLWLYLPEGA